MSDAARREAVRNGLSPRVILLLALLPTVPALFLAVFWFQRCAAVVSCHDAGGHWDYVEQACDESGPPPAWEFRPEAGTQP